ncbi:MAG: hypothetical protein ABI741_02550 [Ferruginibacter sp.]
MKRSSFFLVYIFISVAGSAQISNSYEAYYTKHYPELKYTYDDNSQTHSYSDNWDFDGDGKKDSLSFVGNGGAHLYYHLKLKLSSTNVTTNFTWMLLDFPVLGRVEEIAMKEIPIHPQFVVSDFDADGSKDIYINFDISFGSIPYMWRKRGVTSRQILIKYKKGTLIITNFKDRNK